MENFRKFFTYGFFPKDLPPEFGPYGLSTELSKEIWDEINNYCEVKNDPSQPTNLSFPKSALARRNLHYLNPVQFGRLAYTILFEWDLIEEHLKKSTFATPLLSISGSENKLFSFDPFQKPILEKLKRSASKKYSLYVDIENYYSSIYTHSIDWALNDGQKRHYREFNNRDFLGVKLDQDTRRTQHNQTNGITVGPETSKVISEIILTYIDHKLIEDVPNLTGTRFADDYHLYLNSNEEIDLVIKAFHKHLSKFQLKLNESKLKVDLLPEVFLEPWTTFFAKPDELITEMGFPNERELIRRFSKAFELTKKVPSNTSIRYLLSTLEKDAILKDFLPEVVFDLLLHSLKADPKSISRFCVALQKSDLIDDSIHDYLAPFETTLIEHAKFGNTYEVLWILFLFLHGKRKIPREAVNSIISNMDISCTAYLLLCYRQGLLEENFPDELRANVSPTLEKHEHPWQSDLWLLLYEDNQQSLNFFDIAPPSGSLFEYLLSNHVEFMSKGSDLSTLSTQLNRYEKDIEPPIDDDTDQE